MSKGLRSSASLEGGAGAAWGFVGHSPLTKADSMYVDQVDQVGGRAEGSHTQHPYNRGYRPIGATDPFGLATHSG